MQLEELGWTSALVEAFAPFGRRSYCAGRVAADHTYLHRVYTAAGEVLAEVSGRFRHTAAARDEFPVVGDWVVLRLQQDGSRATIHAVLPRRTRFSRQAAGALTEQQLVAANVDTLFLVMGLDHDFNQRRLERYLLLARESGADAAVVLNKADLSTDVARRVAEISALASETPVVAVSGVQSGGLDALAPHLVRGRTAAFVGSSGVGKSTLINRLLGADRLPTRPVRDRDARGQHTTTHRELIVLPGGALVVDTPGMRELQLWTRTDTLEQVFADVDDLAAGCGFRDCSHTHEPGCRVRAAVAEGRLAPGRLASYHKLQAELRHLSRQQDVRAQIEEKRRSRTIHKPMRRRRGEDRGDLR